MTAGDWSCVRAIYEEGLATGVPDRTSTKRESSLRLRAVADARACNNCRTSYQRIKVLVSQDGSMSVIGIEPFLLLAAYLFLAG